MRGRPLSWTLLVVTACASTPTAPTTAPVSAPPIAPTIAPPIAPPPAQADATAICHNLLRRGIASEPGQSIPWGTSHMCID